MSIQFRRTQAKGVIGVLAVCVALQMFAVPGRAYTRPGRTELASVSDSEAQGKACVEGVATVDTALICNSDSVTSISASGRYVAFSSPASGLVPLDVNLQADVFVRDRVAGATTMVSVSSIGSQAVAPPDLIMRGSKYLSDDPWISANGRFVAFASRAVNLVSGDTNNAFDIFVHDRKTKTTERVSVNSEGEQTTLNVAGEAVSLFPSISADGRFVSFTSDASNLVPDDTNGIWDVFVHDRKTHTTERVSVATGGRETSAECIPCGYGEGALMSSLSADGRFVAFDALRTDLVESDTNQLRDVFVHDRKTHTTERVSVASDGTEAVDLSARIVRPNPWEGSFLSSASPSGSNGRNVSGNGRYVVFSSTATNLVPSDSNGGDSIAFDDGLDVFVHDRTTHRTQRISVVATGEQDLAGPSINPSQNLSPSISLNGRFVTWESTGFLVDQPQGERIGDVEFGVPGIVSHDLQTGSTEFVSWMASGQPVGRGGGGMPGGGGSPDVSANGRYVSYQSPGWHEEDTKDANPEPDVFVRDRGLITGFGGQGGPGSEDGPVSDGTLLCLQPDLCIPPQGALSSSDTIGDPNLLSQQGADLRALALVQRPQFEDLFVVQEIEYMPPVTPLSPVFYGLRFEAEGHLYEVRATSLLGGTFALFDCTAGSIGCAKVTDLRGGYGTTGMRVVFSLPLESIGLQLGGTLADVEAFSALGSFTTGAATILDRMRLARD